MFYKRNLSKIEDAELIAYAASVLNVSEFRLFELSYDSWFGQPAGEAVIETAYMAYVVSGSAPPWVRNYIRKTCRLFDTGVKLPRVISVHGSHSILNREMAILAAGLFLILLLVI
jgi:hypothetical protein